MKVATAAEMRAIDEQAINKYGIPGVVLMENAGVEVYRRIVDIYGAVNDKKFCVFSGKGNNGGDGYVLARHLANNGAKVKVFLLGTFGAVSGDAKINLSIIQNMEIDTIEIVGIRDWDKVKLAVTFADYLVDAIVGTGFQGEPSDDLALAVEIINASRKPVISVDIPSGVDANTGQIGKVAVKAANTITLGLPKPGLLLYPGAEYTGNLSVADIGIPASLLSANEIKQNVYSVADISTVLAKRNPDIHKGNCGRVFVLAGSPGLTGAAALTSTATLRVGAGLVTLGIPRSLNNIMEVKLTEVMTKPLPETEDGYISCVALPDILDFANNCDAVVVGPGLGRNHDVVEVVQQIVKTVERPLVIDADGLNALVGHTKILAETKMLAIITPHPGEMARLIGIPAEKINTDRIGVARQAASNWGCIVVLKGARTIVAFPDGEVYINITGNAGMATGGTGDVLTGVIAGLTAQGITSHAAAVAGVYIHGLAGDIAAQSGQIGLTASDVSDALRAAILAIHSN